MLKPFLITTVFAISGQNTIAATTSSQSANDTQPNQSITSSNSPVNIPSVNKSSSNSTNSNSPSKTFKLSATKVNMGLEQLNDVGLDLKNVLTATKHLYDEVMIQPVTIITEPEMIAAVVISIPIAVEATGPPRPPRKARVDLMMSQIKPVLMLLQQNANEFMADSQIANFPEDMQPKLDPLFKKWLAYMDDVYGRLLDLEKLTVGPTYDNYKIAETCQLIEKDIKQIDEVRRPIYKILQEEGKKLSQ